MAFFTLEKLHIYLTNKCNLNCQHCWVNSNPMNNDVLSNKDIVEAIKQAIPLGLKAIKITGGEPLLFPQKVFSIFEFATTNNLQVALETNGTLLKPEQISALAQHGVKVYISLDGSSSEIHSRIRGQRNNYLRTLETIESLVNNKIEVNIISCIYSTNLDDIENILTTCNKLNITSLKFNFPNAYGRAIDLKHQGLLLSTKKIIDTIELVITKHKGLLFSLDFDVPRVFKSNCSSKPRCSVFNLLSILPNGDYSLCGIGITNKWLTFGSIKTDSLVKVWKNNTILNNIRKLKDHRPQGVCEHCIEYPRCYGHCLAHIITELGSYGYSNPFCQNAFDCNLFPQAKLEKTT
jgi:AdoMet-dependent heme synthase